MIFVVREISYITAKRTIHYINRTIPFLDACFCKNRRVRKTEP